MGPIEALLQPVDLPLGLVLALAGYHRAWALINERRQQTTDE